MIQWKEKPKVRLFDGCLTLIILIVLFYGLYSDDAVILKLISFVAVFIGLCYILYKVLSFIFDIFTKMFF
ncbi:MAG: hypothetical protein CR965_00805 [Paludibacter sp.]|nr:MAG: hypothetical protein CR965_00805 [Paludibacter sp.]